MPMTPRSRGSHTGAPLKPCRTPWTGLPDVLHLHPAAGNSANEGAGGDHSLWGSRGKPQDEELMVGQPFGMYQACWCTVLRGLLGQPQYGDVTTAVLADRRPPDHASRDPPLFPAERKLNHDGAVRLIRAVVWLAQRRVDDMCAGDQLPVR
jgi:hypothetical protein